MRPRPSLHLLRRGVDAPSVSQPTFRSGRIDVVLDELTLRQVGPADAVMFDRVYFALRDKDWNTIPAVVSDLQVRSADSSFDITFRASHKSGEIDFAWQGTIKGSLGGLIHYGMTGEARSDFRYCRIGFCVLHPDTLAGASYEAHTPDGVVTGTLPELIAPQTVIDGIEQALIPACDDLTVAAPDGSWIRTQFHGDLFEMEDQRNWTDASFKTYCTPLALGYPHDAVRGQMFEQGVSLRIGTPSTRPAASPAAGRSLSFTGRAEHGLPEIGLGLASDPSGSTARERRLLDRLELDHIRVDVPLSDRQWQVVLERAKREAARLDLRLEIALYLPDGDVSEISSVTARLDDIDVARWLVFDERSAGTGTTPTGLASRVRAALPGTRANVVLAGGTDGDFAELNRARPDLAGLDAITFSLNPSVHSSDDRSLMENSVAQGMAVRTARTFADGRSICVSPVTLAPRFNPAALGSEDPTPPDELPPQVDVRQLSLFAAAWAVSSIASLSAAGPSAVTYFETLGWRGLMEREEGSPLPDRFPSTPGWAFPVYHVFSQLARMRGGELLGSRSSDPRSLAGLAVRHGRATIGMVANLTADEVAASVGPLDGDIRVHRLDETTAFDAGLDPEAFWARSERASPAEGSIHLVLRPYATAMFEAG